MFGIWLGGTHRIYPAGHVGRPIFLIGLAFLSRALGLLFLMRRRIWSVAAFVVVMGVVWRPSRSAVLPGRTRSSS